MTKFRLSRTTDGTITIQARYLANGRVKVAFRGLAADPKERMNDVAGFKEMVEELRDEVARGKNGAAIPIGGL